MSFTEQQIQAMEAGVGNVLVSAAAGSGKTRVVIERILRAVMRRENPVDIDRMLIVTFTRNAANELRTRIADAMEKALWDDPDNGCRSRREMRSLPRFRQSTVFVRRWSAGISIRRIWILPSGFSTRARVKHFRRER